MFPRLNLAHRFALVIFSVGMLLIVPLVVLQTHTARHALQQRIQASSDVIAEALESLARAHLAAKDIPVLRNELQQIVEQNRFAYVDVFGPDGKALLQVQHPEHPRGTARESDIEHVRDNVLDISHPILIKGFPSGRLDVGIWVEGIERDTRRLAADALLMGFMFCACLAVISWGLGRWLAGRLRNFAEHLAVRAPQDYRHLDISGSDEVGGLVEAFNRLQDRLKESQDRRERAERDRQEMTHMLVHDLKGPLGSFAAGLGLLEDSVETNGDPAQVQLLQLMKRVTERLLRMTQSILHLGRMEDLNFQLTRKPVELDTLVAQRVEEAKLLAQDLGIDLQLAPPVRPLPPLQGDPEVLGRVIDNLVFNALEHTPHGGQVLVSVHEEDRQITVVVRDSGPGIPAEERDLVFEKFQKGRSSKGVGLGLAFSKRAVERHGGHIGVKDAPGGGALFYFSLPIFYLTSALQDRISAIRQSGGPGST